MDGILGNIGTIATLVIVVVVILAILLYGRSRYKIAKADEALVITGGKKGPRIYTGGGAFVSPFRKHQLFSIGVMTVRSPDQETQTKSLVPVVVKWTAQLRPDTENEAALLKAITGFSGMGNEDHISNSLQQTLDGEIRAVVATLTPEQVVTAKEEFAQKVKEGVDQQMQNLGFVLVSLNIAEVSDKNDYYKNLAASDREAQRQAAETLTAAANKEIAVAQAAANQVSESATLDKDLAVAAKSRDVAVQKAAFKVEVDRAEKDAEFSGQLQGEDRQKELATRKGQVKVIEVQQEQAAALARREVELTDADTARQRVQIESESTAKKVEIDAGAAASKLQIETDADAKAAKIKAEGAAAAAIATAKGTADAKNLETESIARNEREIGLAKAEVIRAQGQAEAEALLAKGEAEAKAELALAEAMAANGGANLQIRLAEIQRDTTVTVYTELGHSMSTVGEKATFIDMGGSGSRDGGDLLTNVLGNVPKLLKSLDIESSVLNGMPLGASIGAFLDGVKGKSKSAEAVEVIEKAVTAHDASQASEVSKPELSHVDDHASATAPAEVPVPTAEPAPTTEFDPSTIAVTDQLIADGKLGEILAQAKAEGTSLTDLASHYGVTPEALEEIVNSQFTTSESAEERPETGKVSSSRKRR